jgi:tetratricopeptide (TPR) repeat protein
MFGEYAQALPLVRKAYEEGAAIPLDLAEACFVNDRNEEAIELLEEQLRVFPSLGDEWEGVWFMSAAHAARESGQADVAKRYRDRAAAGLTALKSAGYVTYGGRALGWTLLHAFDGDEAGAAENAVVAIETDPFMWRMLPRLPELAAVSARPDVQAAIRAQEAMVARQRVEVLRMLCGPDPVSKTYQPAPGTCVGAGQPG